MQVEQFAAFASLVIPESLGMKVCEVGDSLCTEVEKFDLSTKRRKKAVKTPRMRNLRLRIGWDLGLIIFCSVLNCLKDERIRETHYNEFKSWVLLDLIRKIGGKDREYGALGVGDECKLYFGFELEEDMD